MEDAIRENATMVIDRFQELTDFNFGFNLESIEWVDGYVERIRQNEQFNEDLKMGLANTISCYIGQAIIELYGGKWEQHYDGDLGIRFSDGVKEDWVFPYNKVLKQLENGNDEGESIYSFVTIIPQLKNIRK